MSPDWQAYSLPLSHRGSPFFFLIIFNSTEFHVIIKSTLLVRFIVIFGHFIIDKIEMAEE